MRLPLLLLVFVVLSCTHKDRKADSDFIRKDINLQLFDSLVQNCDEVRILFDINPNWKVQVVGKVLTEKAQILHLKDFISNPIQKDSCSPLIRKITLRNGTISFRKDSVEMKGVDFELQSKCPSFYFMQNGKAVAYAMTDRGSQYLSELDYNTPKK